MQLKSPGDTAMNACCADPSLPPCRASQAAVLESSSASSTAPDASSSSNGKSVSTGNIMDSSSTSSTGQGDSRGTLKVLEASTSSAAAPTSCSLASTSVMSQHSNGSSASGDASSSNGDKGASTARSKDYQEAKPSARPQVQAPAQAKPRAMLEAAAQRLYAGTSAVKLAVVMTLLRYGELPNDASKAYIRTPVLLGAVANAARLPSHVMAALLTADPCFEVLAAAGGHSVVLNAEELLDRAAAAGQSQDVLTSKGTHTAAECVSAGVYPLQPGNLVEHSSASWQLPFTYMYIHVRLH